MRRSLVTVLGCLVIGATLTLAEDKNLAQAATQTCAEGRSCNYLNAACHLGSNGEIRFVEAEYQDNDRRNLAETCRRR